MCVDSHQISLHCLLASYNTSPSCREAIPFSALLHFVDWASEKHCLCPESPVSLWKQLIQLLSESLLTTVLVLGKRTDVILSSCLFFFHLTSFFLQPKQKPIDFDQTHPDPESHLGIVRTCETCTCTGNLPQTHTQTHTQDSQNTHAPRFLQCTCTLLHDPN